MNRSTIGHRPPSFKGLTWHRNPSYSFFVPQNWHQTQWADGREGVIFAPSADDPLTVLAVEVQDLGTQVMPDDLDDVVAGFIAGIEQLPDCHIESHESWVRGDLIGLEAKYTFREQETLRKRWVRQFYYGTRQIAITAQGATGESYDYWLPMFFEAMMTTRIHHSLPQMDSEAVS